MFNYDSTRQGSGSYGSVNVTDGGKFGVNAAASSSSGNSFPASPATDTFKTFHLTGSGGLASVAFAGPLSAATPGTADLVSLALGSGSIFALNLGDAQGNAGSGYDTARTRRAR